VTSAETTAPRSTVGVVADSTTIAITSLVVGGFATVAGPTAAAWLQARRERERLHHEERAHDVVELRRLLDDAAMELDRLNDVLHDVVLAFVDRAPYNNPDLPDLEHVSAREPQALRGLKARLAIRLGRTHDAVVALTDAINAVDARLESIGAFISEKIAEDPDPTFGPRAPYVREEEESGDAIHSRALDAYREAEDRFLDAAQAVGSPVGRA
jgi:hypothetical protein